MRVLLTTDVAGGVWTYTEELASGLVSRGHAVLLVAFGGEPGPEHRAWLASRPEIEFVALPYPLEWMPEPEPGLSESGPALRRLVESFRPDVAHLNQFFPASLDLGVPKLVAAHSDVISWWHAVKRAPPPDDGWFLRYRGWVERGLAGADLRIAPTAWMAAQAERIYGCGEVRVVHNGRSAAAALPDEAARDPIVLTVGRLWDEGKGARDLVGVAPLLAEEARVVAAGPAHHPAGGEDFPSDAPGIEWMGILPQRELAALFRRAAVYVGTSRYEPFGLAPLEAALGGCALVLTDIPTFRELWDGVALFYPPGEVPALLENLRLVLSDAQSRRDLGAAARERAMTRFSAEAMTSACEALYAGLAAGRASTASAPGMR